jgi:Fe-S cluster assembly protein SufD
MIMERPEQQYIDLFTQYEAMICRHSAEVLNAPRSKAFADFERLGFPTRKQEDYKYTDVGRYFAPDYGLNLNRLEIPVNPYEVFKCDVPNMSTSLYFVVNDAFDRHDSPTASLPEGVEFGSLCEIATRRPELIKKYYAHLADTSEDALAAFNTLFAQDGVVMYVPKGVVVERPIQLVNILRADVATLVNRRLLIILEEGAQAKLLICDHAMDEVNFLSTQVAEVFVGENASLDLYELEETHYSTVRFSNLYVHQSAGSRVLLNGVTLHNGTTRNRVHVVLDGPGAEVDLCGMAIADRDEQVDNHTFIDPVITSFFQFQSQFRTGSLHNASFVKHMNNIRFDIIQQALVVSNNDTTGLRSFQFIDSFGHNTQSVNIQTRVCFIQNTQFRFQHGHLENLVTFLLST